MGFFPAHPSAHHEAKMAGKTKQDLRLFTSCEQEGKLGTAINPVRLIRWISKAHLFLHRLSRQSETLKI